MVDATDTMNMPLMRTVRAVKIVNMAVPSEVAFAPQYWLIIAVRVDA